MSFLDFVTPLTRNTLGRNVYSQLSELLVGGHVMPGEQISLRRAAEALGVSVMPVRDAVSRLVAEQALEITANRALRVPLMSVRQFQEITTIRINLEGLAVEAAAREINADVLAKVQASHERFAAEMDNEKPDGAELIASNKALHFSIYDAAKMPTLFKMIEGVWLRIGPILNYDLRSSSRRIDDRVAVEWHSRLVKALRKRDGAAARAALQGDIESAAKYIALAGGLVAGDRDEPNFSQNVANEANLGAALKRKPRGKAS